MIVVDTDPLLYWANGSADLPIKAKRVMNKAAKSGSGLIISPMSLYEIAELVSSGHLVLNVSVEDWLDNLVTVPTISVAPITPSTAVLANELPGDVPNDIKDRLIMALARERGIPLVTANPRLIANPSVETIWDA